MPREEKEKEKGGGLHDEEDEDSSDSIPPLVHSSGVSDGEELDEDRAEVEKVFSRKATSNSESVEMWFKQYHNTREKHYHVMKIRLLSPFLFGLVYTEDKWINWAFECKLLPSKSSFDIGGLNEEHFQAVDIVEDAFDRLKESLTTKENIEELLNMMDKIHDRAEKLDKAFLLAESFTCFPKVRENMMSPIQKRKGDVALLLAYNQVYVHIKELTRNLKDLTKDFEENCKSGERETNSRKGEGNNFFIEGRYLAAISSYSKALHVGPFSYILYGNRAQSYLKTKDYWCALADGRRAVVLKPEWQKGQYRYAEAFLELGMVDRAVKANDRAMKICKNDKDLIQQCHKLKKKHEAAKKKPPSKKLKFDENNSVSDSGMKKKHVNGNSEVDDLPDLVDPDSSDCSASDDDDVPSLVDGEDSDDSPIISDSDDEYSRKKPKPPRMKKGRSSSEPPELVSDVSSEDSDSDTARHIKTREEKAMKEELLNQKKRKEKEERKRAKLAKEKKQADKRQALKERKMVDKKAAKERNRMEKMKKMKQPAEEEVRDNPLQKTRREFNATVKQGSKALLDEESKRAVHCYRQALELIAQESLHVLELKNIDYVLLLYAHGIACLETGVLEDINSACKQFQKILDTFSKDKKFPLAYYGLGRVYQKQNRFLEALEPLEQGLEIVNSGEKLTTYRWPGSQVIIEETKPGKLLIAIQGIITICKHPPKADAVCRFTECASNRTHIYLSDYDYKGFVRLVCSEACHVEFHPVCWKKFKSSNEDNSGDKDFIDATCMTPDCSAPVMNIQIYDSEGLKTEFKSEKPKSELKNKIGKQGKAKAIGQPHKKHKKEKLDEHKQFDQMSEHSETGGSEVGDEKNVDVSNYNNKNKVAPSENEEKPSQLHAGSKTSADIYSIKAEESEQLPLDPDTGVYILKKPSAEDEVQGKAGKSKTKKKKAKQNTQSLGEFLKDHGGEQEPLKGNFACSADELDEIPAPTGYSVQAAPLGWSSYDAPFAVPSHLQEQAESFEQEYRSSAVPTGPGYDAITAFGNAHNEQDVNTVRDYVASMLKETLLVAGALQLADPQIVQPLSMLPDNYQVIIHKAGGLRQLLAQSPEFMFKGTNIMLTEEMKLEESIAKIGKFKNLLPGEMTSCDVSSMAAAQDLTASPDYFPSHRGCLSPQFNPNAKEFVPKSSSETSLESGNGFNRSEGDSKDVLFSNIHSTSQDSLNPFSLNMSPFDFRSIANGAGDIAKNDSAVLVVNGHWNASLDSMFLEDVGSNVNQRLSSKTFGKLTASNGKDGVNTEDSTCVRSDNEPSRTIEPEELIHGSVGKHVGSGKPTECLETSKPVEVLNSKKTDSLKGRDENAKESEQKHFELPSEISLKNGVAGDKILPSESYGNDLQKQPNGKLGAIVSESVISNKSKGTQTQPLVKSKAIMTEPLQEPYKAEYYKVMAERDSLQEKLKDAESKQAYHQNRHQQEMEKYKKKAAEFQEKIEKIKKEHETTNKEHSAEKKNLEKEVARLTNQVTGLEQQMVGNDEKYKASVANLKKELSESKAQVQSEKESLSKLSEQLSQKDAELSKLVKHGQTQQARARDAEVKLLELRRDVGLRFLERAFQEAHLTIKNLRQARNARHHSLPPTTKFEELLTAWQNYGGECHTRIVQCKATFNEQIQLVKDGRPVNSLPLLSIPGAPQYPGPPLLQHLVASNPEQPLPQGGQPQQFPAGQAVDTKATTKAAAVAATQKPPAATQTPAATATDSTMSQAQNHLPKPASGGFPVQAVQQKPQLPQAKLNSVPAAKGMTAAAQGTGAVQVSGEGRPLSGVAVTTAPAASAAAAASEPKPRPSNSFEKIMLRLSTMYPNYTRLELTGFIKEVRNNKHGSLTGLSLEDIVASVSDLVGKKKKTGQLRATAAAPVANPQQTRSTGSPRPFQQPTTGTFIATPVSTITSSKLPVQRATEVPKQVAAAPKPPVAATRPSSEDEDPCVICHEDMNISRETVMLECGHKYHSACIRKWLMGEQSTCPTCRVHALLPDEFPRLK